MSANWQGWEAHLEWLRLAHLLSLLPTKRERAQAEEQ